MDYVPRVPARLVPLKLLCWVGLHPFHERRRVVRAEEPKRYGQRITRVLRPFCRACGRELTRENHGRPTSGL